MPITKTIVELQAMIRCSSLLEPPAGDIVKDLAQQLIDVQVRLKGVLPETLVASPEADPALESFIGEQEPGIYNAFVSGVNVKPHWDVYVDGFFDLTTKQP